MSKRVRLTQRKAADMSVPYPGNVNQPDRKDPAWDQYHTFEQRVNHELPDMRHEWKDDERDEIGFGIPENVKNPGKAPIGKANPMPPPVTTASRIAANKAVKLAVLLLGEKVSEDVIEQQARDFLSLDREAMDRTLARFASTQKLYADDAEDDDDEEEVTASEKKAAAEPKKADSADLANKMDGVPPAIQTPKDPQVVDKQASEKKAEDAAPVVAAAPAPVEASAKTATAVKADAEDDEADTKSPTDMDIELQGAMDDEPAEDAEADAKLARVFEGDVPPSDDEDEPVVAKAKTAKKAGITRLGGQPKVASEAGDPKDLSNLWATAPDVSDVFK